jgi:hypothetical protein
MAACSICSNPRAKEINRWLLTGRQMGETAKEFGFNRMTMAYHRRKHLPYRSERAPKAVTVVEQLAELKYELDRLRVLAETGEPIGAAISAVTAKRAVLELEARLAGLMDAHHKKLILNSQQPAGDYRVEFVNGRPRTVLAGEK